VTLLLKTRDGRLVSFYPIFVLIISVLIFKSIHIVMYVFFFFFFRFFLGSFISLSRAGDPSPFIFLARLS